MNTDAHKARCPTAQPSLRRELPFLVFLVLVALTIRLRTLTLGTDVDTGCFLVMARSMAEGKRLYSDILCNLTPLAFILGRWLYPIVPSLFVEASRLIMVVLSASCVVPIFFIGRALFGRWAGFAAGLFFALDILSLFYARQWHVSVLESIITTWALWAIVAALRATARRAALVFAAGFLVALSFLAKQSAVFIVALYPIFTLLYSPDLRIEPDRKRLLRDMVPYVVAFLGTLLLATLWLAVQGTLRDFWDSVVGWNLEMRKSGLSLADVGALAKLRRSWYEVFRPGARWLWLLFALASIAVRPRKGCPALMPVFWLLAQAAFMMLFYYEVSDHYFLPWVAPTCLLTGYGVVLAARTWQRSLERGRLSIVASCGLIACAACLWLAGWWLRGRPSMTYSFAAWGVALVLILRLVLNLPSALNVGLWTRVGYGIVAGAVLLCVAGPYWRMPRTYPEPYVSVRAEKTIVGMVKERLKEGEDVAVIACDVMTLYGGWPELPVMRDGLKVISPMAIDGALREWSPNPQLLADTVSLWEREHRVRFIVIYGYYWGLAQRQQNVPLCDYIRRNYDFWRNVNFDTGDYYGLIRIYERRTPFQRQ